jgi:hypothetical protein
MALAFSAGGTRDPRMDQSEGSPKVPTNTRPTAGLLRLVVTEPDHEPLATPKLHVLTVNELLRLSDGFAVITAGEALKVYEMAIMAYAICPVIRHEQRSDQAGALPNSQPPMDAEARAVMADLKTVVRNCLSDCRQKTKLGL